MLQRRTYASLLDKFKGIFKPTEPIMTQMAIDKPPKKPVVEPVAKSPLQVTPAARYALLHRLGLKNAVSVEQLTAALMHPAISSKNDKFTALMKTGQGYLMSAIRAHVKEQWPKLPVEGRHLASQIYSDDGNLRNVAAALGIPHAILPYQGPPYMHQVPIERLLQGKLKSYKVYADIFKAILGTLPAEEAKAFVQKTLFQATFDTDKLVNPRQPVLILSRLLAEEGQGEQPMTFRLHHESGRCSNDAIFVVGVYGGKELLAEADGPSIHVAQHRAALSALRKRWLSK